LHGLTHIHLPGHRQQSGIQLLNPCHRGHLRHLGRDLGVIHGIQGVLIAQLRNQHGQKTVFRFCHRALVTGIHPGHRPCGGVQDIAIVIDCAHALSFP
jgi:hypothetical protein